MVKPAKEAEKVREVGVHEASIRLLDATYCGPYHVLVRERKKLLLEIGVTQT